MNERTRGFASFAIRHTRRPFGVSHASRASCCQGPAALVVPLALRFAPPLLVPSVPLAPPPTRPPVPVSPGLPAPPLPPVAGTLGSGPIPFVCRSFVRWSVRDHARALVRNYRFPNVIHGWDLGSSSKIGFFLLFSTCVNLEFYGSTDRDLSPLSALIRDNLVEISS